MRWKWVSQTWHSIWTSWCKIVNKCGCISTPKHTAGFFREIFQASFHVNLLLCWTSPSWTTFKEEFNSSQLLIRKWRPVSASWLNCHTFTSRALRASHISRTIWRESVVNTIQRHNNACFALQTLFQTKQIPTAFALMSTLRTAFRQIPVFVKISTLWMVEFVNYAPLTRIRTLPTKLVFAWTSLLILLLNSFRANASGTLSIIRINANYAQ